MGLLTRLLSFGTATALAVGTLLAMPSAAFAQAPDVAYISSMSGNVSITRGDSGNAEAAAINAPLMVGDYLATDPSGRSEVQFDSGHILRVGPNTQLRFAQIDYNADTVQLASGEIGVGVVRGTNEYTQIETPSVTIRPRDMGYYRVDVNPQNVTAITVRDGAAAVLLPQGTQYLDPGSTMLVWGDPNNPQFRFVGAYGENAFDQWNMNRDNAFMRSAAYQQDVPAWMPGAYDLDDYGTWQNDPAYGQVWTPNNVAPNWSPYSNGRWVWEPYYGWTWVDYAQWGYAPFHYGRWYRYHDRWAWYPGGYAASVQPWSPALVAFIGFNTGNFSFGLSLLNNVGWVPLAPAEPIYPWWGPAAYPVGYNVTYNVISPTVIYANARWPNAVRWVGRSNFASGNYRSFAAVPARYFAHAAVVRAGLPIAPDPPALRYTASSSVRVHAATATSFHSFRTTPHTPATFAVQRRTIVSYQDRVHIVPTHAAPPQAHFVAPQQRTQFAAPRQPQQHNALAPRTQFAAPQQQRHVAPAVPHYAAPAQHAAPQMRTAPAPHYAAPQMRTAPAPHYAAPAQHAAPTHAAPSKQAPSPSGHAHNKDQSSK